MLSIDEQTVVRVNPTQIEDLFDQEVSFIREPKEQNAYEQHHNKTVQSHTFNN